MTYTIQLLRGSAYYPDPPILANLTALREAYAIVHPGEELTLTEADAAFGVLAMDSNPEPIEWYVETYEDADRAVAKLLNGGIAARIAEAEDAEQLPAADPVDPFLPYQVGIVALEGTATLDDAIVLLQQLRRLIGDPVYHDAIHAVLGSLTDLDNVEVDL